MKIRTAFASLALFMMFIASGLHAAAPTPSQILSNVQKKYKSLRSIEIRGTSSRSRTTDGQKQSGSARYHLIYQRPGKLRNEIGEEKNRMLVVSDGKNIYTYRMDDPQYMRDPVKSEKELLNRLSGAGASTMSLLSGRDFLKAAHNLKTVGNARIAGRDCYIIQFALDKKASAIQKLWVGTSDWLAYKNELTMTVNLSAKQGTKKRTVKVVQIDSATISSMRANPSVKSSTFAFKPPKGVTRFDQKQAEAAFKKQMQEQVKQIQQAANQLHGKPAPAVSVKDTSGKSRNLSSMKGDVVILSFWASRQPASSSYMKSLQKIYNSDHNKGLEILALSLDQKVSDAKSFTSKYKITFPIATAEPKKLQEIAKAYRLAGVPTTFIIDKSGKVKEHFFGVPTEAVVRTALKKAGL